MTKWYFGCLAKNAVSLYLRASVAALASCWPRMSTSPPYMGTAAAATPACLRKRRREYSRRASLTPSCSSAAIPPPSVSTRSHPIGRLPPNVSVRRYRTRAIVSIRMQWCQWGVGGRGRRERDGDGKTAFGQRPGGDRRVVGGGDGADDREAEAVTLLVVGAARVEPLERLEEPVDLAGLDDRAGVRHCEHGIAVVAAGGDTHAAAVDVVSKSVVDEIGDEGFEQPRVSVDGRRFEARVDLETEPVAFAAVVQNRAGDDG